MQTGFFKNLLSYITDISLEKSSSPYNPYLEVLLVKGRHQLITKNAIYSYDDKYDNFYKAFKKIDWDKANYQNVLVLGLGLGSVNYMLERNFNLDLDFTCVEIDPEIIRLAQKYTLSDLSSPCQLIQTDAASFLNIDNHRFDLVLMDVFQNAKIPSKFDSVEMLELLKSKLSQNGLLIYNRMNNDKEDVHRNNKFVESFKTVFPDSSHIKVKDNLVLFSDIHMFNK